MSTPADPLINVRAKTQLVSEGVTRYMGEQWQMPLREGLGLVGAGETEQWVDPVRPLVWAQNAPGPHESWQQYGDPQTQGSREGAVSTGLGGQRGGTPGDQQTRQIAGQNLATNLQPQSYDDYRSPSTAGLSGSSGQWWQLGAVGPTGGAAPGPISPVRPGAQAGQLTSRMPGGPESRQSRQEPESRQSQREPQQRPQGPQRRGGTMYPQQREGRGGERGEGRGGERGEGREGRGEERQEEKFFKFCEKVIEEQQETIRLLMRRCCKCEEEDREGDRDRGRRRDRDRDEDR